MYSTFPTQIQTNTHTYVHTLYIHFFFFKSVIFNYGSFPHGLVVNNLHANAGDVGDMGSIPESGRPLSQGNDNPLQYCCLEDLIVRGTCWVTVHRVTKSQTRLK